MKKIFIIFICFFSLWVHQSDAMQLVSGNPVVASGGGCASDSVDQTSATESANINLLADAYGQSFQVGANGTLSAIELKMVNWTTGDVTVRWGTSKDLTTYEAGATLSVSTSDWYKFTFSTKASVSTSTTYYFGIMQDTGDLGVRVDSAEPYASGTFISYSSGWSMGADSANDATFRVYLCD